MEIRELRSDDLQQAWELDRDAFHGAEDGKALFLEVREPDRIVGAFEGTRLVAMSAAHGFGQWFGGRRVPMGGLSSVAVAPHRRGRGLARQVVGACLDAMRARGEVISSLFPATTRLYRRLGWEVAGSYSIRKVQPRLLQTLPLPDSVAVRPGGADDYDAIRACYDRLAPQVNGFLDRSEGWWGVGRKHVLPRRSLFLAEADGELTGYLVYRQIDGADSSLGGPFRIVVDDLVWTTRDAGLALWRLLGSWASQAGEIVYRGGAEDSLLLLSPEQDSQTIGEIRWMTRIVDAEGAVLARGFPLGIDVEVPFELEDARFEENAGRWLLHVRKGRGRLERGGPGGPRFEIGSFSSLYTGWATTTALARAGRVRGGSAEERALLDAAFAGPTPWLLDEF